MTDTRQLNIRASDDGKDYIVSGYAVLFDLEDLYGTHFSKNTDFWESSTSDTPPLMFDHASDPKIGLSTIGQVTKKKADEIGIWFEATLERANKYAEAIADLVRTHKMGVSTGTSPHMMSYDGAHITSWPIYEVSLTPTPAEPATIGHLAQRSLAEAMDTLEVAIKAVKAITSEEEPAASDTGDNPASLTEGLDAKKTIDLDIEIEQFKRSHSAVAYRK